MSEVKLKKQRRRSSACERRQIKEEPELCVKQEPEEFPFHMVSVKPEDDEDKPFVLHQRSTKVKEEETEDREEQTDSSDTDHSEDYGQEQAPGRRRRSYTMIPADSHETEHRPFSRSNQRPFRRPDQRTFRCSDCGKRYRRIAHLQRHYKVHCSRKKPYKCTECSKKFAAKAVLKQHIQSVHTGERHRCSVCGNSYAYKANLTAHMRIHTGKKLFICSLCDLRFVKKSNFTRHQKQIHLICPVCRTHFPNKTRLHGHLKTQKCVAVEEPKKPVNKELFSCSDCGKKFKCESNFELHVLNCDPEERPHKCSLCDKSFYLKYHLKHHNTLVHQICPVCKTRFQGKVELKAHLKIHVEEGTLKPSYLRTYSCSECGKSFRRSSHLQTHMSVHTGQQRFKCSLCEKGFKVKFTLTNHQKLVHHVCPACKAHFPDKIKLDAHLMTHVEWLKYFRCSECGKRCRSESMLQTHMLIHTEEKPYKCPVCEKSYIRKFSLSSHMKTHSEEDLYKCSVCDKRFGSKQQFTKHQQSFHHICPVCKAFSPDEIHLIVHLATHVEEGTLDPSCLKNESLKPFSCSDCGKRFSTNSLLQTHTLVHTVHTCPVCETLFPDEIVLNEHLKTHEEERTRIQTHGPLRLIINRTLGRVTPAALMDHDYTARPSTGAR